jgi:hypothetical protein
LRVGGAVRLSRLAVNKTGDSGVTALAAALPQMPSLTTLILGGTATRARCLLRVVGACASVVGRQLALCASACGRSVGCWAAGFLRVGAACAACAARRQLDRSLGRHCAGGGAAADAEPHDAHSRRYGHACALRALCRWGSRIGGWAAACAVCFGVRARGRMLGGGLFKGRSGWRGLRGSQATGPEPRASPRWRRRCR